MGNNAIYRGYVTTMDGRQYLIANLKNPPTNGTSGTERGEGGPPIDFTQPGHNTYLRGRTNSYGNTHHQGLSAKECLSHPVM